MRPRYALVAGIAVRSRTPGAQQRLSTRLRTNPEFGSVRQFEIVATLDEHRSGSGTSADRGANRRAFTAACDRPDHGTNRGADSGALHRASGLTVFVLNA